MFLVEILKDPLIKKRDKLMFISIITMLVYLILAVILIIIESALFGNIRTSISEEERIIRIILSLPYLFALIYVIGYLHYAFIVVSVAVFKTIFERKEETELPFKCDLCGREFKTDEGMVWINPAGFCAECYKKA